MEKALQAQSVFLDLVCVCRLCDNNATALQWSGQKRMALIVLLNFQ